MGKDSKVEWGIKRNFYSCGFWQGCRQTSDGCKNCYAKAMLHRWKKDCFNDDPRIFRVENARRDLLKWNRAEEKAGTVGVVFVNPQGDIFEMLPENHPQYPTMVRARNVAFETFEECESLFFLLCTKRSRVMAEYMRNRHFQRYMRRGVINPRVRQPNVGLGVTVENADNLGRVEDLLAVDCALRFVSCEPLLGAVDLETVRRELYGPKPEEGPGIKATIFDEIGVDWIIVGGESGPHARPMNPDWVRSVRDQCKGAGVPFLFKQWGEWAPCKPNDPHVASIRENGTVGDSIVPYSAPMARVGKKHGGRELDGHEHMEIPEVLK